MNENRVSGVVVTYHPDADVLENLAALGAQIDHVVVVDNGSTPGELEPLREAARASGFELIENGNNLGIATALNIGVRRAQVRGAEFVLLFDQDSQVTPGFATSMVNFLVNAPVEPRIGILVPRYVDKRLGNVMESIFESDGQMECAMTSGSLTRMKTFNDHGLFMDELFIDGVDHEYSLRLRALGYIIDECKEAVLLHSPGTPSVHNVRWRQKRFLASNYNPIRRYYQERNKIFLLRRYHREFAPFCLRQLRAGAKDLVKIVLFEDRKPEKLSMFFRGMWHGVLGRTGKLTGT